MNNWKWLNWRAVIMINVVMAGFVIFVLPAMAQLSAQLIGSEQALDTVGRYTTAYLYEVAEIYGSQGRFYYTVIRYTFDIIWPLVYWSFLSINLAILLRVEPRLSRGFLLLLWLPTLALIFDLAENFSITYIFWRYPQPTAILDQLAPWFSQLKWLSIGGSFVVVASLFAYRIIRLGRQVWQKHKC
ncbi:MAG: hypothetical protein ACRC17_03990 [Culicoidibacterales bacterium]